MRLASGFLAVVLLSAPLAASADYYSYVTDSGTLAYTDDPKYVPARYRDAVERHAYRSFADYPRLTVVPRGATIAPSDEVLAEFTSEPAAETLADTQTHPARPTNLTIDAGPQTQIDFDAYGDSDEPIFVTRRVVWERGAARTQTVVRRGDETLAIIDGPTPVLPE
jgi:hypothetical protein